MLPRTQKRGFTLIELLVVVSIIALLVSILMPALGRAREQAKSLYCQTNLKQIMLATCLFAEDHEGFLPPGMWYLAEEESDLHNPGDGDLSDVNERNTISGYVSADMRQRQIFTCPIAASRYPGAEGFNYGYNQNYCSYVKDGVSAWGPPSDPYLFWDRRGNIKLDALNPSAEKAIYTDMTTNNIDPSTGKVESLMGFVIATWNLMDGSYDLGSGWTEDKFHSRVHPGQSEAAVNSHDANGNLIEGEMLQGVANVAWADGHVSREPKDFRTRPLHWYNKSHWYYLGEVPEF